MSVILHPGRFDSPQTVFRINWARFQLPFVVFCFATIATISALDTWFAVSNSCIMKVEKNPICLSLMRLEPTHLSFFVAGKTMGTLGVLLALVALHRFSYKHASLVTMFVALFQVGLLTYLTLSDPMVYNLPNFSLLFDPDAQLLWRTDPGKYIAGH